MRTEMSVFKELWYRHRERRERRERRDLTGWERGRGAGESKVSSQEPGGRAMAASLASQMATYYDSVPPHQAGETSCEPGEREGDRCRCEDGQGQTSSQRPPNQAKGQCGLRDMSHTGRHPGRGGKGIPGLERPPLPCFAECSTLGSTHSADTAHSLPSLMTCSSE